MKRDLFFRLTLCSCSLLFLFSGCAPYSNYPPGTIKQISPVVEQETVTLTSQESGTVVMRDEYLLGPGDVLFVNVSGKPELSTSGGSKGSRVDGSGNIHLPFVNNIKVAGLTLEQAQSVVQNAFKSYLKEPWAVIEIAD